MPEYLNLDRKPVLAKNLSKEKGFMQRAAPALAGLALVLCVLGSIGDLTVHHKKGGKSGLRSFGSEKLTGKPPVSSSSDKFEKYEFRLPKKVIPGSVLHILAPGLEEPQPVKIPMNAVGGELMSINVPKQQLDGEEGEGVEEEHKKEGGGEALGPEDEVEVTEEAASKVFVGTEMGAKHYFLLIVFLFGGSLIIFHAILGLVYGFGPLPVEGALVIDHPCRHTVPQIAQEAAAALESVGDDVGGTPQSSPRKSMGDYPTPKRPGTESAASGGAESPRSVPRNERRGSLSKADMRQFIREEVSVPVTGEQKGLDILQTEGATMKADAAIRAASQSPTPSGGRKTQSNATVDQDMDPEIYSFASPTVLDEVVERGKWLLGLLILQSFASAILNHYEHLIRKHLVIAMFLTMLIGAGGNTGAQSVARVIQAFSAGNYEANYKVMNRAIQRQLPVSIWLAIIMAWAAWARVWLSNGGTWQPTAIAVSCGLVVFVSVHLGTVFPFLLANNGVDAMHSAALIQVTMDILGVLLTCVTCTLILGA